MCKGGACTERGFGTSISAWFFFFQAEDGIRDYKVTGVQTCALPISALLRSAWDYTERLGEFLAWIERVASLTMLLNPPPVVRWNADKHYLLELARAGLPVVPSSFAEAGAQAERALEQFLTRQSCAELVVKPAVGAGSRDTRRHARTAIPQMLAHMRRLLGAGRSVLLQPYLEGVDRHGETAVIHIGGGLPPLVF